MEETEERTTDTPKTVGGKLRAAREARGQTLEDIGRQTRVPVRHLVQIEAGNLEGLPAAPYSAGFVKAYARAVDLDPVALSHEFRGEFDRVNRTTPRIAYEPYEPADPVRLPPRMLAIVALLIAILLAGGYAIIRSGWLTGESGADRARLAANGDATQESSPAGAPVADKLTAPASTPIAGGPVVLTAVAPVWFEVTDRASNSRLFTGVLDKGKTFEVPITAGDPVIRTGKPEGLAVTVGGKPVAPLGEPAHTIANVSLKAAALTATPLPAATGTAVTTAPAPAISGTAPARQTASTHRASAPAGPSPAPATSDATASSPAFRAAVDGNGAAPSPQP